MFSWPITCLLLLAGEPDMPAGWKTFAPDGGRFAVALPGTPTKSQQQVKTATGQLDVTVYVLETKQAVTYLVTHSDLPAADVKAGTEDRRLDFARDGAVTNARGKLRGEKRVELDGYPGRDLIIETDRDLVIRMRVYAVGRRLYQVSAVGPGALVHGRDTGLFLDSFRLVR